MGHSVAPPLVVVVTRVPATLGALGLPSSSLSGTHELITSVANDCDAAHTSAPVVGVTAGSVSPAISSWRSSEYRLCAISIAAIGSTTGLS